MDQERQYWLAFSVFPGIGPVRFKLLLNYFGSAKDAWEAPVAELKSIKLGEKLSENFNDFRKKFDVISYQKELSANNASFLILSDERYPKLLRQIPDAPFVLYIKGKKPSSPMNMERTIAVVGTRKITKYGEEVTRKLVEGLVGYGFTIVSGLAYGVDAIAHKSAIDAGGKTIAVLGCGIDIIAPPSNANLYRAIAEDGFGAIISEMPLGLRPNKGLFPARNRIISGLSLGVIVTEGADDSGALITARNAGEQGREVFAVPGSITSPYSRGPAILIKKGAKLIESVEDVLEELNIKSTKSTGGTKGTGRYAGETKEEEKIINFLSDRQMNFDEIVRACGLTTPVTASTITVLEMKGIIKDFGEKKYGIV